MTAGEGLGESMVLLGDGLVTAGDRFDIGAAAVLMRRLVIARASYILSPTAECDYQVALYFTNAIALLQYVVLYKCNDVVAI